MANKMPDILDVFSKRGHKFLLFVISYLIVSLFASVLVSLNTGGYIPFPVALMIGPIYFPYLMMNWLSQQAKISNEIFYMGWFSYIVIMFLGVIINNIAIVKTLFIIFIILLLFNLVLVLSML